MGASSSARGDTIKASRHGATTAQRFLRTYSTSACSSIS